MIKYDVANTPIVDLVNKIILVGVKSRASDIHFDPMEDGLKVRIRVDGELRDHTIIPKDNERNVITRIKLISGMNITENRLPQDGAIKGRIDNINLDMRVSSLPTNEGEKVVIRILDYSMSFATVLRSILRQDPNIILIGEIRDSETAKIAVRASITGHLVLSTIHTNNSLSTIERLLDMDVERYLLSSALEGIISQKLARRICPHCRKSRPTTPLEKEVFKRVLNKDVEETWEAVGCENCISGYLGRIAIQEVLLINEELRDIISSEETTKEEIREIVYGKDNTVTLLQDGLEKVLNGYTTFDEIYKLIEIEDDIDNNISNIAKNMEDENKK